MPCALLLRVRIDTNDFLALQAQPGTLRPPPHSDDDTERAASRHAAYQAALHDIARQKQEIDECAALVSARCLQVVQTLMCVTGHSKLGTESNATLEETELVKRVTQNVEMAVRGQSPAIMPVDCGAECASTVRCYR
jgi:hypothetical protein